MSSFLKEKRKNSKTKQNSLAKETAQPQNNNITEINDITKTNKTRTSKQSDKTNFSQLKEPKNAQSKEIPPNKTVTSNSQTIPVSNSDSNLLSYDLSQGDWIIDTDPGVDDAFALTLAMNILQENLKLISIQCGNVGLEQCVVNAKKLCVINKRKFNISKGGSYTISTNNLSSSTSIHGNDGFFDIKKYKGFEKKYNTEKYINEDAKLLGELKRHSAIEILSLSKEYPEVHQADESSLHEQESNTNIKQHSTISPKMPNHKESLNQKRFSVRTETHNSSETNLLNNKQQNKPNTKNEEPMTTKKLNILTIGPLTNLALAYMLDPSLVNRVNRLVVMGGSYASFGNIKACGEFNFACDDIAAKKVLQKFKNVDVYCWEPSLSHLIKPENISFTKEAMKTEKAKFLDFCVEKKMSGMQPGVYADYGAAVVAFFPQSVLRSFLGNCDVIVDTEDSKKARMVVFGKDDVNCVGVKEGVLKDGPEMGKHRVIVEVDLFYFHGLFNRMVNC